MTVLGRRFQIVFFSLLGLFSILAFQNCSPFHSNESSDSQSSALCSGDNCTSASIGKNGQSGNSEILPDSSFCASITNKELVYDLNFGDSLNIEVPFASSCAGAVHVSRLNLSENPSHLTVRLPSQEVAFVGKSFSLTTGGTTDVLFVRNVNNYGETRITLNYSLSFQGKTISVPVKVIAKTAIPPGHTLVSETKMACLPKDVDLSTIADAFQIKDTTNNQWSHCQIHKCADGHYFNSKGQCEKLVIASECALDGEYRWGTNGLPPCYAKAVGTLAVGATSFIPNTASGYRGKLKSTCQMWESEKSVSQELGKSTFIKINEPTLMVDYAMGTDINTSSLCQQTEFKSCKAYSEEFSTDGDSEEYKYDVPVIAHGDNIFVHGIAKRDPRQTKKRMYGCLDGNIRSKSVSDDYKLPNVNVSVENTLQSNKVGVLKVSLWGAVNLRWCMIEITSVKGDQQKTSSVVSSGTYDYRVSFDNITSTDGEVYIFCTGDDSTRVYNIPYTGLKR